MFDQNVLKARLMDALSMRNAIEHLPQPYITGGVLCLAVIALIPGWTNYDIIARDGAHLYVPVATLLLEGRFHEALFGSYQPLFPLPLYETLIFVLSKISGLVPETAGRLISASCYVLGSLGMYKATEQLLKDRIMALLSVLFFLANKQLLHNSVDCLKESLLVCIIIWGNYFILKGIVSQPWKAFYLSLGAVILLAGAMVRSTALIFLGSWLLLWVFHQREGLGWRSMIVLVPACTLLALYYLRPDIPLFRRSFALGSLIAYFHKSYQNPLQVGNASARMVLQFLGISQYVMPLFGLVGVYHFRMTSYTRHYLFVLAGYFLLCIGIGWQYSPLSSDRYILAPALWLIPVAAYEIVRAWQSTRRTLKYLAILTVAALPFIWAGQAFKPPDDDRLARKETGLWIHSRLGPHQDVVSNREWISFYAQGNIVYLADVPTLENAGTSVAQRYPENSWLTVADVMCNGKLIKTVAIDTLLEDGRHWKNLLDKQGIQPDASFRSILVYLPWYVP
jgi:hypothetical protein